MHSASAPLALLLRGIQAGSTGDILKKHLGKAPLLHEVVGSERLQEGAGLASRMAKSVSRLLAQARQKLVAVGEHLVKSVRPAKKHVPKAAALFAASMGAALAHKHRGHLMSVAQNLVKTHGTDLPFLDRFRPYEAGLQEMVVGPPDYIMDGQDGTIDVIQINPDTGRATFANQRYVPNRTGGAKRQANKAVLDQTRMLLGHGIKSKLKKAAISAVVSAASAAAFLAALKALGEHGQSMHLWSVDRADGDGQPVLSTTSSGNTYYQPSQDPEYAEQSARGVWSTTKGVLKSAAKYAGVSLATAAVIAGYLAKEAAGAYKDGFRIAHVSSLSQTGKGVTDEIKKTLPRQQTLQFLNFKAEKVVQYLQQEHSGNGIGKRVKKVC